MIENSGLIRARLECRRVTKNIWMGRRIMTELKRRAVLQAGAAMFGAATLPTASARAQGNSGGGSAYEFMVKDIVYQRSGGKERLARLYQPAGSGPFPAVLQVHGGAWTNKNRTDGQNTALDLAAAGIVVL